MKMSAIFLIIVLLAPCLAKADTSFIGTIKNKETAPGTPAKLSQDEIAAAFSDALAAGIRKILDTSNPE